MSKFEDEMRAFRKVVTAFINSEVGNVKSGECENCQEISYFSFCEKGPKVYKCNNCEAIFDK